MPDRLSVDLDGLEAFGAALRNVQQDLGTLTSAIEQDGDELGGPEVQDALDHFDENWSDGRGRVVDNCEQFVKLVDQAVQNLRKADDQLRDQLTKSGS